MRLIEAVARNDGPFSSTPLLSSQLQRLKRSLSFKTKSIRSKSADNFFRTSTRAISATSGWPRHTPPTSPSPRCPRPSRAPLHRRHGHCFMEHIFKKPTFCDVCNHMIVACGNKVDPVYEALRFGTSLAQKAKRASGSESPHRNSVRKDHLSCQVVLTHSAFFLGGGLVCFPSVFTVIENGMEHYHQPERKPDDFQLQKDILKLNTYVALYSFTAQESHDLEMRAGDRILLADDSNDDWWKGVIEDRIGFFPAAFAHQVRAGDQVFRCNRTFIGCKEQGQITLKEGQICVSSEGERSGFIKVASGKKRGFVPCDVLEII
uniref:SH3 and cysteine rich domain n=1 Tax=Lates calcarifer TaxID=8187 RepID=A0A4W6F3N2_LATCA